MNARAGEGTGCHSVMGGGTAMGPPVVVDAWRFESDDETLYKLVRGQVPEQTMQAYPDVPDEQVWKVLAHVRSPYRGDPAPVQLGAGTAGGSGRDADHSVARAAGLDTGRAAA